MKKEINIFEIDGVNYWEYEYKMTKEEILKELDFFRKTNRPSYLFINALLEIKSLQCKIEELRRIIDAKNKIIYDDKKYHVLYWFMFIIWLIIFGVGFRKIVEILIDLIK